MTKNDCKMPLYLEDSSLYVKLVCIYATYADGEGLHYEPLTFEQYDCHDWTEDEWKEAETERREEIKINQHRFVWAVGALARIANGNFNYDEWWFLQQVWDALGIYGGRDEELDLLYEKLHKAWSRKLKQKQQKVNAVRNALDRVEKQHLA